MGGCSICRLRTILLYTKGTVSYNSTLTAGNQENPPHMTCSPQGQGMFHHFFTSCAIRRFASIYSILFFSETPEGVSFPGPDNPCHRLNMPGKPRVQCRPNMLTHFAPSHKCVPYTPTIILIMTHLRAERQRGRRHQHRQSLPI